MVLQAASDGASTLLLNTNSLKYFVIGIEIDGSVKNTSSLIGHSGGGGQESFISRCLIHGTNAILGVILGISNGGGRKAEVFNNIIYNLTQTASAAQICVGIGCATTSITYIYNNTIYKIVNNNGSGVTQGVLIADNANVTSKNNISTDPSGTTSGSKVCYSPASFSNAIVDYNLASDDTDAGANSIGADDGVVTADQFVSTVGGSEDLHLKAGADAINEGEDLGTTPSGVEIDIDGRDRDAEGDTWDMGADEFVVAVETITLDKWYQECERPYSDKIEVIKY